MENSVLRVRAEESSFRHWLHIGQKQSKTGKQNTREKHAKIGFPLLFQLIGGGLHKSAMGSWMGDTGQKLSSDLKSFTGG